MERRLAAILAADAVAYSRLMEVDEDATLATLRAVRQYIDERIVEHGGRVFGSSGDSVIAEFASPVEAVRCALIFQRYLAAQNQDVPEDRCMRFRVGINLGDVVAEGGNLHGDAVNVAARLEAFAEPGGICVSGVVHDHLAGKLDADFYDLGDQTLKNLTRPVRIWGTSPSAHKIADRSDKPTIAVLPFDNMSGDPEQAYFADGITEDIITALSKNRWLAVIARNTSFAYRGKSVDIRRLAGELGAKYVVEGSVRRAGERIRVTAQLIDTDTGNHLWAERYDRKLEDIFDVQDEITDTIAARVEPEVGAAERERVARGPRTDLRAWDHYHLGVAHFYKFTAADNLEAQRLLQVSRELDPNFGEAHAWWAYAVTLGMVYWDTEPDSPLLDEALAATNLALELDDQNAVFYALKARVQLARREYTSALAENEMAVKLNPTFAAAYCGLGDSLCYEGRYDEAIGQFEKAVALSPNNPQRWAFLTYGAMAFIFKQDFESALIWAAKASEVPNCQYWTTAHSAVALAYLERQDEAQRTVARLLVEKPGFNCKFAKRKLFYLRRPEQMELYLEGLRLAGVPA
ncbi:MAG: adenylate/guanylate cyclase domain-containing protein [Alphaproteobacteria bacterium]